MWNLYPAQPTPFGFGCCDQEGQNCHFQEHYEHAPNMQSCSPFHSEPSTPEMAGCNGVFCEQYNHFQHQPQRPHDPQLHLSHFEKQHHPHSMISCDYTHGYHHHRAVHHGDHGQHMHQVHQCHMPSQCQESYPCYQDFVHDQGHPQQEVPSFDFQQAVQGNYQPNFQNFSIPEPKRKLLEHVIGRHVTAQDNCSACKLRSEDGSEQVISLNDLVDIVAKTMESVQEKLPLEEPIFQPSPSKSASCMSKKRMQNKEAAARYRQRQKSKLALMQEEIVDLEKIKKGLLAQVDELDKEIKKHRKILALD